MEGLAPHRNTAQKDGGGIHCFISSHEILLTFCESYEVKLVLTQTSRRHYDGTV